MWAALFAEAGKYTQDKRYKVVKMVKVNKDCNLVWINYDGDLVNQMLHFCFCGWQCHHRVYNCIEYISTSNWMCLWYYDASTRMVPGTLVATHYPGTRSVLGIFITRLLCTQQCCYPCEVGVIYIINSVYFNAVWLCCKLFSECKN